jgi:hypothetical protein
MFKTAHIVFGANPKQLHLPHLIIADLLYEHVLGFLTVLTPIYLYIHFQK